MAKKIFSFGPGRQRIVLDGIQLLAHIGVYPREKRAPQPVSIDLELQVDLIDAAKTDALAKTTDYAALADRVLAVAAERHRHLIETLAYDIAVAMLEAPRVLSACVTVHKPGAVPVARDTSVTLELVRER